jgi:biopolymer transport protein TolR
VDTDPNDRRYLSEINVVPLVDVVLVLLIIFMITAPLLYRGIDIQLPTSRTNTIEPTERLVVTVEKDGAVYLNKEKVPETGLEAAFATARARNPEVSVYLRADSGVPYGLVVGVMDAVKRAGISQLGMVTEPIPSKSGR